MYVCAFVNSSPACVSQVLPALSQNLLVEEIRNLEYILHAVKRFTIDYTFKSPWSNFVCQISGRKMPYKFQQIKKITSKAKDSIRILGLLNFRTSFLNIFKVN